MASVPGNSFDINFRFLQRHWVYDVSERIGSHKWQKKKTWTDEKKENRLAQSFTGIEPFKHSIVLTFKKSTQSGLPNFINIDIQNDNI